MQLHRASKKCHTPRTVETLTSRGKPVIASLAWADGGAGRGLTGPHQAAAVPMQGRLRPAVSAPVFCAVGVSERHTAVSGSGAGVGRLERGLFSGEGG